MSENFIKSFGKHIRYGTIKWKKYKKSIFHSYLPNHYNPNSCSEVLVIYKIEQISKILSFSTIIFNILISKLKYLKSPRSKSAGDKRHKFNIRYGSFKINIMLYDIC